MPGVAILLVSHSRALAEATAALIRQVTGADLRLALAAGSGEEGAELGTDVLAIQAAIEALDSPAGTLILMDMGSALLSTEMALNLLTDSLRERVQLSSGPFVEGAMAAALAASGGAPLSAVRQEAENGLGMKQQQLASDRTSTEQPPPPGTPVIPVTPEQQRRLRLSDPAGLHLRPAAALAKLALARTTPSRIRAARHPEQAVSATSLTAMLGLDLRQGDELIMETSGADAAAFFDAAAQILATPSAQNPADQVVPRVPSRPGGAVAGFAQGPLLIPKALLARVPETHDPDSTKSLQQFQAALEQVQQQLSSHPIVAAQALLLQDPVLLEQTRKRIQEDHLAAAPAWAQAITEAAARMDTLSDPIVRARAADLRDLGQRVLQALGIAVESTISPGAPAILLVDELLPSVALHLDPRQVLGVIDRHGSAHSHAAILLRGAGIPYIINADNPALSSARSVAMDGSTGEFWLDPDPVTLKKLLEHDATRFALPEQGNYGQISLSDGSRLELWANVASAAEADTARRLGATGIGLLRTEFFFLDQQTLPDEENQTRALSQIMAPMQGRPIIVRALDAGADKPLGFMPLGDEANPALGRRGLRALLAFPDIFALQLRAMLRAGRNHQLSIMLPMVTNPEELREARGILEQAHHKLEAAGQAHRWPVPLGIMAEVPAVALCMDGFNELADFVSIGSNDLTQYTLASDRSNPLLDALGNAAHPAVLELCRKIARDSLVPVSICGEAAGDPDIAPLLVDCGLHRLSMAPRRLPEIFTLLSQRSSHTHE